MQLTQRQINLAILAGMALITGLLLPVYLLTGAAMVTIVPTAVVCALFTALGISYWRGWEPARYVAVVVLTLITGATMPGNQQYIAILITPILALVLSGPIWVIGSALVILAMVSIRAGASSVFLSIENLSSYLIAVGGLVLSRLAIDAALKRAHDSADRAERERATAEERAVEVGRQAEALAEQNQAQQKLIGLINTLETPAVSLADGVLLAPVMGNLDSRRADLLTRRLLDAVHQSRARLIILDVAGVSAIDTQVAGALTGVVRSVRLLGCEVIMTGISASVATTLIQLGVTFDNLRTAQSPQDALASYWSTMANGSPN